MHKLLILLFSTTGLVQARAVKPVKVLDVVRHVAHMQRSRMPRLVPAVEGQYYFDGPFISDMYEERYFIYLFENGEYWCVGEQKASGKKIKYATKVKKTSESFKEYAEKNFQKFSREPEWRVILK